MGWTVSWILAGLSWAIEALNKWIPSGGGKDSVEVTEPLWVMGEATALRPRTVGVGES